MADDRSRLWPLASGLSPNAETVAIGASLTVEG